MAVGLDGLTVLLASAGITSIVTVLAGVLPALRGIRLDLTTALAQAGRSTIARV